MIEALLSDLDGTLLPMDQDLFVKTYFGLLAKKVAPLGYEAGPLVDGLWKGIAAMVHNDGSRTNAEVFWECFAKIFGEKVFADMPVFDSFYRNEFNGAAAVCGYTPAAGALIRGAKERGLVTVLASNPVFPRTAQESRLRWAGVNAEDFSLLTSYENSSYCKPNPDYYREIAKKLSLDPTKCLMVGNDAEEDGAAAKAGMKVFLLTDCLINAKHLGFERLPHGGYPELLAYLAEIG